MNKFLLKTAGPEKEVKKAKVYLQEEPKKKALGWYTGSVENSMPHGPGHLEFSDGSEYIGDFFEGAFHGKGVFTQGNGSNFLGVFENGEINSGIVYYSNGDTYEGKLRERLGYGKGKLTYSSGDVWEGVWCKDKREGPGTLIRPDGDVFQGVWVDDKHHTYDTFDSLFKEAARIVVEKQQSATSLLQIELSLGYFRASMIVDQLEAAGIVGPFIGAKAREVKVKTINELEKLFEELNI